MKKGDYVMTPRFMKVKIEKVFRNEANAIKAGFKELTYYDDDPAYGIYGKSLDQYHVIFAAFKK